MRLGRIGSDHVVGYLSGGPDALNARPELIRSLVILKCLTVHETGGTPTGFAEEERMNGVYDGLTVVELADRRNQWAGKLLSDGGARVIQIEPVNGSPGRWCGPFVKDKVDPDSCLDY